VATLWLSCHQVRSHWPELVTAGGKGALRVGSEAKAGLREIKGHLGVFHPAMIRQSLCFPDRWLVQYDAGKLQTLAR
jgi:hypothetical protein